MANLLKNASFRAAAPNSFFAASTALTTAALHCSPRLQRQLFLVPVLTLNALALLTIDGEATNWGPGGLNSVTGLISCFYSLAAPLILFVHERSVLLELEAIRDSPPQKERYHTNHPDLVRPSRLSVSTAWRIWNNPRALKLSNRIPGQQPWGVLLRFALTRLSKMIAILLADHFLIQPCTNYIDSGNFIEHYASDQEPLLRRVIFRDPSIFDSHVLSLRAVTAIWWIWNSVCALETGHAILAVTSVCILRLDDTTDWPPLYGNPFEAYTIRRFWGKFWHSCMAPSAWAWSSRAAHTIGLRKGTASEKAVAAFGVFLVSGLSHAVVAWRNQEGEAWRDVLFFVANYGIIAAEKLASCALRESLRALNCDNILIDRRTKILGRILGLLWVFGWFFWMTPRWLYPKFYTWSLQLQQTQPAPP